MSGMVALHRSRQASGRMSDAAPFVSLTGMSKSFFGVKVLKDVSFDVRPGEVHALLGENGAGKSTLIKMMSGLYSPDEGTIVVDGKEVKFASTRDALGCGPRNRLSGASAVSRADSRRECLPRQLSAYAPAAGSTGPR